MGFERREKGARTSPIRFRVLSLGAASRFLQVLSVLLAAGLTSPAAAAPATSAPAVRKQPPARPKPLVLEDDVVRFVFRMAKDGIRWASLFDKKADREMLADEAEPFWIVTVEDPKGHPYRLDNRAGWRRVSALGGPRWLTLAWSGAAVPGCGEIEARCEIGLFGNRTSWKLYVDNRTSATVRSVVFPRVVTRPFGGDASDDAVVFPRGPGERKLDPFANPVRYRGDYPGGWASYQFIAQYDGAGGLYVATHDPAGSTKHPVVETTADGKRLAIAFEWPAADYSIAGNDFQMPGPGVVQVFRGDWFDAARIYNWWARKNAVWWPRYARRRDTPRWMHETAVWAMAGGTTQSVVGRVRDFATYMGVPTAFHWYSWHEIPFDNNYPHYFPAKRDFREGVEALQAAGVRVMPYINGRLWDTDLEDFAKEARPFAAKDKRGKPYIEVYGSGEKLAVMCPATRFWQNKVRDIVLRLIGPEFGVDAVYIDQVAAARPRLCFDSTHGHPLGGGCWWVLQGYRPMLKRLRTEMKKRFPNAALTTECNAEPYLDLFDGYLTWHWQYQDQVPVFPAIYGGRIQMFGRAYRGGPTKDLALRMKAAQSLVFGEQIGWITPDIIKEQRNAAFIRRVARLRYALRDYLADGEMARPPRLEGRIPDVTADWRWSGDWPVTDRAVQAGAWRAFDGRLALIFVNVTSGTLKFAVPFDGRKYGLGDGSIHLVRRTEIGAAKPETIPSSTTLPVTLGPFEAVALEMSRAGKP